MGLLNELLLWACSSLWALPALFWTGCCCVGGCEICAEDWQGLSDSSDIDTGTDCGWTEDSGSWEISGAQLLCTSAGTAICDTTHPDSDSTMVVEVEFKHSSSSGSIDIIVARQDSSNFHFARYSMGPAGLGDVRLYKVVSGTTTQIGLTVSAGLSANSVYTGKVCISDEDTITAYLGGTKTVSYGSQTFAGDGCALRANGTGTGTFDDFTFSKSHVDECEECEIALVPCYGCTNSSGQAPFRWQLVISGSTVWSGTYVVEYMYFPDVQGFACQGDGFLNPSRHCCWIVDLPSAPCSTSPDNLYDRIIVRIDTSGSGNIEIRFTTSTGGGGPKWRKAGAVPNCLSTVGSITAPGRGVFGCDESGTTATLFPITTL